MALHRYTLLDPNGKVIGVTSLPAIYVGRRRLVRRSSLADWKRQNERCTGDAMLIASQKNHAEDA